MKKILSIAFLFIVFINATLAQNKVNIMYGNQKDTTTTHPRANDVPLLISPTTDQQQDTSKVIRLKPKQLVWKDAQPPMPAGAKVAVLEGSPKADGMFTIRMKLPPHWLLPAHWHPGDERVTVLSGTVFVGFGEKLDTAKATRFSTGSFYINPAMSHHYVFTSKDETVIQITAHGPWGFTYIEEGKGK